MNAIVLKKLTVSVRKCRSGREAIETSPFNSALLTRKLFTFSTISFMTELFGGRFLRTTCQESLGNTIIENYSRTKKTFTFRRN